MTFLEVLPWKPDAWKEPTWDCGYHWHDTKPFTLALKLVSDLAKPHLCGLQKEQIRGIYTATLNQFETWCKLAYYTIEVYIWVSKSQVLLIQAKVDLLFRILNQPPTQFWIQVGAHSLLANATHVQQSGALHSHQKWVCHGLEGDNDSWDIKWSRCLVQSLLCMALFTANGERESCSQWSCSRVCSPCVPPGEKQSWEKKLDPSMDMQWNIP